jgi:hypothetical protein
MIPGVGKVDVGADKPPCAARALRCSRWRLMEGSGHV